MIGDFLTFMGELVSDRHNVWGYALFGLIIYLITGVSYVVFLTLAAGWYDFKLKREVKRLNREAEIQARIDIAKQKAEDAAPKPWIY